MKRIIFIFLNIFFLICLLSCQKDASKAWTHIQNEDLYIWTGGENQNFTYSWDGGSFDKLIHGPGTLSTYCNDSLISQRGIVAYYGAISKDDITTLSDSSFYIGRILDNLFEGFGVYLNGGDVYIGAFIQSKPSGPLTWHKYGTIYYRGEWENGNFHG